VVDRLEFPGTDPDVRARLEGELAEVGAAAMHERLTAVDPKAAAAILPQNARRVVRALEVVELTGAAYQAALPRPPAGSVDPQHDPDLDVSWVRVGLTAPRDELDARIAARVDRMWAGGLVDEVQRLVGEGLREGRTAARALGYSQVLSVLDGRRTEVEARADTVRATQRYVRRQESWFRRDGAIRWLDAGAPDGLATALALADA
jgi:tRNA dimethylallyltransferase